MCVPIGAKELATALTVISASIVAEAPGPLWGAIVICRRSPPARCASSMVIVDRCGDGSFD
jgi:hypothetical protein